MQYAPIVLFTYNRLDELMHTVNALQKNFLAQESDLFIYSDAARNENDIPKIQKVREYLHTISGFKSIHIIERESNFGLAKSVIQGASEILDKYGKIIVLEDDIITSVNFLCYMNSALEFYREDKQVFSISGHTIPLKSLATWEKETYVALRPASWGWATWKDQWENIDWNLLDYDLFIQDRKATQRFNLGGVDLTRMLRHYREGKNNSWAIRWAYAMYKAQKYAIYPKVTKVQNIGFSDEGTHCNGINIYESVMDTSQSCEFDFVSEIIPNKKIVDEFRSQYTFFSKLMKKISETIKKYSNANG
ncbi:MAG: glycosyltransferase [Sulfuricurvum sp.]|nr:glycosyltransferase [Sulfuricurvum sp.]